MSNPNADNRFSVEVVDGSPEGVEYGGPRLAFDRINKGLWAKTTRAAINTGWVLISGAGIIVQPPPQPSVSWKQIYFNNGNPNGVVMAEYSGPCICLDTSVGGDGSGQIFWKTDGLLTNTGWY